MHNKPARKRCILFITSLCLYVAVVAGGIVLVNKTAVPVAEKSNSRTPSLSILSAIPSESLSSEPSTPQSTPEEKEPEEETPTPLWMVELDQDLLLEVYTEELPSLFLPTEEYGYSVHSSFGASWNPYYLQRKGSMLYHLSQNYGDSILLYAYDMQTGTQHVYHDFSRHGSLSLEGVLVRDDGTLIGLYYPVESNGRGETLVPFIVHPSTGEMSPIDGLEEYETGFFSITYDNGRAIVMPSDDEESFALWDDGTIEPTEPIDAAILYDYISPFSSNREHLQLVGGTIPKDWQYAQQGEYLYLRTNGWPENGIETVYTLDLTTRALVSINTLSRLPLTDVYTPNGEQLTLLGNIRRDMVSASSFFILYGNTGENGGGGWWANTFYIRQYNHSGNLVHSFSLYDQLGQPDSIILHAIEEQDGKVFALCSVGFPEGGNSPDGAYASGTMVIELVPTDTST